MHSHHYPSFGIGRGMLSRSSAEMIKINLYDYPIDYLEVRYV
jgi:hypothetical protein